MYQPNGQAQEAGADIDRLLAHTAAAVTGVGRDRYLEQMLSSLARAIEADELLLGLVRGKGQSVRTAALWRGGSITKNLEYQLDGTPCSNVLTQGACSYPSGVQELFPNDALLRESKAEAYVGTPLVDSLGRIHGLLAAIYIKPLSHPHRVQSVLQICAGAAALHIELQLADEYLTRSLLRRSA